jgi:hypothetical protein
MKRAFLAVIAATLCLTGCSFLEDIIGLGGLIDNNGTGTYKDQWANLVNETKHDAVVNGNTIQYGSHSYTVSGSIEYPKESSRPTASVSFTNIPSGYTEFEAVYTGLLGKSLQGTMAMVPMAIEIYARNAETGKKCFTLLCKDSATVQAIITILKSKIVPSVYSPDDDSYIQRYLPAALLKGANYENAYKPDLPYTVECGPAPTSPQETKMAPYGTVYFTYIYGDGWDSRNRGVDVFLPKGDTLHKVQGCSSCYTQCKTIFGGPWGGLQ